MFVSRPPFAQFTCIDDPFDRVRLRGAPNTFVANITTAVMTAAITTATPVRA